MTTQDKNHGLLWMLTFKPHEPLPREAAFDPDDAIYHLSRKTRNPFLERAITPTAKKLDRTPEELHKLFRVIRDNSQYDVSPTNTAQPYKRRDLPHPAPRKTIDPKYLGPEKMRGDIMRLPWMIELFFKSVLSRLEADPARFKLIVEELMAQFQEDGVRIKIYDAYRTFSDWDDLVRTLKEIGNYPAPETFDLFCSALFAYYDLAYPPE